MNELLLEKLDVFYKEINDCDEIKEILKLKEDIYNDSNLKYLLQKYKEYPNKYDKEFIELKRQIINNNLIKRFHNLENELYFITLEINKRLNNLVGKKECNNENN